MPRGNMKNRAITIIVSIIVFFSSIATFVKTSQGANNIYNFYGGPPTGTFILVAKTISDLGNNANIPIRIVQSSGSNENIWRIDSNEAHFTISYSSHVYKAINGLLQGDNRKYRNIRVIGYLYGAQAHLIVKGGSQIAFTQQLKNKRVGLGLKKSGSGYQGTLFLKGIGLWDNIYGEYIPQNEAAKLFCQDKIDAFWVFSVYPNLLISGTANTCNLNLLDIRSTPEHKAFFSQNPYFTKSIIPGGTYNGVKNDTVTYEDSALLIANKNVPNKVVRKILELTYAPDTIKLLTHKEKSMRFMKKNDGKYGICAALHEGAKIYYDEMVKK
jgi:uncharacterized protein